MKKIFIIPLFTLYFILLTSYLLQAQQAKMLPSNIAVNESNIITVPVPKNTTTHIVSPEPILYVDISDNNVQGEISEKNICRIKPDTSFAQSSFVVTVVTENFIQVYKLVLRENNRDSTAVHNDKAYVIAIDPTTAMPVNSYNKLREQDFYQLALSVCHQKRKIKCCKANNMGIQLSVRNIFIAGDFLLFDIAAKNKTSLPYTIDELRFKITDKRLINAHISQDIELKPVYTFRSGSNNFAHQWRNIYAFRKFTFPVKKIFNIEMTEQQISGRKIRLAVDYNSVLHAATVF